MVLYKNQNLNLQDTGKSDLYLEAKYEFGMIDGDTDLKYEKSIPIDFAANELNAISYTKGCYVGQEVISRAKYQGVIRKKIYQRN